MYKLTFFYQYIFKKPFKTVFKFVAKFSIKLISKVYLYILIILIWQLVIIIFKLPDYILPSFLMVIKSMIINWHILLINTKTTVIEAFVGIVCAIVISVVLAWVLLYIKFLHKTIYSLVLIWQIIPLMAVAPLFLLWFGFGIVAKIMVVFLVCLFPCLVALLNGFKNINQEFVDILLSMQASKFQIFKLIILPNSMYSLFAGIKIAITYSVTSAIVAEYLGAQSGLGVYMAMSLANFNTKMVFAIVICTVVITLLLYKSVEIIEERLIKWNVKT